MVLILGDTIVGRVRAWSPPWSVTAMAEASQTPAPVSVHIALERELNLGLDWKVINILRPQVVFDLEVFCFVLS